MLDRAGLSVRAHQPLTLERYDASRAAGVGRVRSAAVRSMLHSADCMAWSYAARRQGGDQNDWMEAFRFAERIAGRMRVAGDSQPGLL